jgi:hypothetical protein
LRAFRLSLMSQVKGGTLYQRPNDLIEAAPDQAARAERLAPVLQETAEQAGL